MDATRKRLDALLAACDAQATRDRDPVGIVHRYRDPRDQEVVGLVAASLAFGNVVAARRSIERALDALGAAPAATVAKASGSQLRARLEGFVHRIYRDEHIAQMLSGAGFLLRTHGSLGRAFSELHQRTDGDFRETLARFADSIRGSADSRNMRHLISDPRAGSACKRLLLYARWMVRPADGVDLGLWSIAPSELVIPVDTHVHRIGLNLGLTRRLSASWATAEEITATLRRFDPEDPVKYDFALCHLGVSRECPSRRDADKCASCVLQQACGVWQGSRHSASAKKTRELRL